MRHYARLLVWATHPRLSRTDAVGMMVPRTHSSTDPGLRRSRSSSGSHLRQRPQARPRGDGSDARAGGTPRFGQADGTDRPGIQGYAVVAHGSPEHRAERRSWSGNVRLPPRREYGLDRRRMCWTPSLLPTGAARVSQGDRPHRPSARVDPDGGDPCWLPKVSAPMPGAVPGPARSPKF